MLMGLRITRKGLVDLVVLFVLLILLFVGMDRFDQFSSDWNRTFGANMPNSTALREKVSDVRSGVPDVGEEFIARAEANASNSESLLDVMRGVADLFRPNATPLTSAPAHGTIENQESPYDHLAD